MATQTTEEKAPELRCKTGRMIHVGNNGGQKRIVVPCNGEVVRVVTVSCEEGKHIHDGKPVCERCLRNLADLVSYCGPCLTEGRASRLNLLPGG